MSDNQRPAASQAADPTEDAPSALEAVQAALDRRDNGGAAGQPAAPAAAVVPDAQDAPADRGE